MGRVVKIIALSVLLSACVTTEPVVVIEPTGQTLKGATRDTTSSGMFSVTDGKLTCSGSYNPMSRTLSAQILCSDGRKGIITATRDASGISGHGTGRLTDGSEWTFIFGPSAKNF
jgi:hypothetical protein